MPLPSPLPPPPASMSAVSTRLSSNIIDRIYGHQLQLRSFSQTHIAPPPFPYKFVSEIFHVKAPPDQDPLETCFPIGDGIVARCVATGLAFQTRYGGSSSSGGVPDPPSARGLYHNTNANAGVTNIGTTLNLALAGPADLHALPLPDGYNIGSPSYRYAAVAANGAAPPPPHPQPLSAAFRGWKKGATTDAGPESASTVPPPPASWEDRRNRAPGGDSPVPDSGGGRGRSRLAFFPASDGYGSSRSPSPAGRAGLGGSRGYGFMSSSPPPAGEAAAGRGTRFWSKSESSPSPGRNRQHQRRQRSPSLARRGRTGAAAAAAEDEEGAVVAVACLPVTGGAGGQAMMGVLKVGESVAMRCGAAQDGFCVCACWGRREDRELDKVGFYLGAGCQRVVIRVLDSRGT